ncbi:MAG: hypothetical protein AB1765_13290, partial [Candidatus Hydrogenedentota bacterium]
VEEPKTQVTPKEPTPAPSIPATTEIPDWTPEMNLPPMAPPAVQNQAVSITTIIITTAVVLLLAVVSFYVGWTVGRKSST